MTELEETAYHEAGHTIASIAYFISFDQVTIKPNTEAAFLGRLQAQGIPANLRHLQIMGHGSFTARRVNAQAEVQIDASGVLAHLFQDLIDDDGEYEIQDFDPISELEYPGGVNIYGTRADLAHSLDVAEKAFPRAPRSLRLYWILENTFFIAKELLERWPDVDAVAKALIEKETLDQEDVYETIENKGSPYPKRKRREIDGILDGWQSDSRWKALKGQYCLKMVSRGIHENNLHS